MGESWKAVTEEVVANLWRVLMVGSLNLIYFKIGTYCSRTGKWEGKLVRLTYEIAV